MSNDSRVRHSANLRAFSSTGEQWPTRCWVCGNVLGPKHALKEGKNYTATIVRDGIGVQHLTHSVCSNDADGKVIGVTTIVFTTECTA